MDRVSDEWKHKIALLSLTTKPWKAVLTGAWIARSPGSCAQLAS